MMRLPYYTKWTRQTNRRAPKMDQADYQQRPFDQDDLSVTQCIGSSGQSVENPQTTPPPPLAPSNYYVWDSTNTTLFDQSLRSCQPTSNTQESFLAFADNDLSNNQLLTRLGLVSRQGYLENVPDDTLLEAFAVATTNSQCSYSASSQQAVLADLGGAIQLSPSPHSISFENFPSYESSERPVDTSINEMVACATDIVQPNEPAPPPPTQVDCLEDFPDCMLFEPPLEQPTVATTDSQCSYPGSNQHFISADHNNALQLSLLSNNSSKSTLWEQSPDAATYSEYTCLVNNQATLTNLRSTLQPDYTEMLDQKVLQSSIVLPLSLASTEYPTLPGLPHSGPIVIQSRKHYSHRPIPCPGCRIRKIKCKKGRFETGETRCLRCIKQQIPAIVCSQERVTKYEPFKKWKNPTYEEQFTLVRSNPSSTQRTTVLRHYPEGPTLQVNCCEFYVTSKNQICALRKNSSGWHSVPTPNYCLIDSRMDISEYVQNCTKCCIDEVCKGQGIPAYIFQQARQYYDTPIIRRCFEMYTALCLMMKGWEFSGNETLGLGKVQDATSAWNGTVPVSRMVTNQLNHLLELEMGRLDGLILGGLKTMLESRKRHMWVVVTLTVFLLVHIRELDAGSIIFWGRYEDKLGFWIHPSQPKMLLEEAVASSNSVLSHYHYSVGQKPLAMNWDEEVSKDTVNHDPKFINSVKALQNYQFGLKQYGLIGRKACDLYEDGNPRSVAFTASSLVFVDCAKNGCEVKDFY